MRFAWGAATDVGRVRTNNQDSYLADDDVWAVADGMGGHRGGEVASHIAIDVLSSSYEHASLDGLREAARVANDAVFHQAADDPELRGMGTTLVAVAPVDGDDGGTSLGWVNIGDSRLYRLRDGQLEQISQDHSLVEEMVRDGRIAPDEARTHPQRNILTRALGIDERAIIDAGTIDPYDGDRFLLCSDGLFNEVDEGRMAATLRRLADPGDAARELVRLALEGGGRDNITVVVVDVVDDDDAAAKASATIAEGTAEGRAADEHGGEVDAAAAPVGAGERRAEAAKRRARGPRRLTVRVVLFVIVLVALLIGTSFAVYRVARGGYTVKARGADVVIYRGTGDQVLWLKPSIEENLGTITVQPRYQQAVRDGQHFGSLSAARAYAAELATNAGVTTTTTTTTTSTSTSTSTTTTTTTTVVAPP